MGEVTGLRIGDLAERAGVSVSTLRAWERRHGILAPDRTPGGHRIYRPEDVVRVATIRELVDRGWSVEAAARQAERGGGAGTATTPGGPLERLVSRLWAAIDALDEAAAHEVLDATFARFAVPTVLDELIAPTLRRLGEGWEEDPAAIAREHLGSHILRTRLVRLMHEGPVGRGRSCVAYCPEGELHDIGLIMASLVLQDAGWRVRFLGAGTPWPALDAILHRMDPDILLVAACLRAPAERFLHQASPTVHTVLGGAGFEPDDVDRLPAATHHAGAFADVPRLVDAAAAAR